MFVWIGDELSLHYNDAAILELGRTHPATLGRNLPDDQDERWRTICGLLPTVKQRREVMRARDFVLTPIIENDEVVAILGTSPCTIEPPMAIHPAVDAAPAAPRARRRLMLVEDNDDTARALKTALEQLGYEVAVAHDAPIALNLARTFNPDIALLDLGLPVMDGWELAKRLRDARRPLPIVALTARDQESDRQRSSELGFIDHLVKPINLPQLQHIVDNISVSAREGS